VNGEVDLYFQESRERAGHRVDEWRVGAIEGNLGRRHRFVVGVEFGVLVEHRGEWRHRKGLVASVEGGKGVVCRRGLIRWVTIQITLSARG
jgi:hypothetical protein